MDELTKQLAEVRTEVSELKTNFASQRPVNEIVKYLLYFWVTISVILGIFGWKQLSDIGELVKLEVASRFPEDSQNYLNYEKLILQRRIGSSEVVS